MKPLANFLIENDVFIKHIFQNYMLDPKYIIPLNHHSIGIQDKFNIDINPYVFIVEQLATTDQKEMFYISLNYYLKLNDTCANEIKEVDDIKTIYDTLCYIYMVQYFFL